MATVFGRVRVWCAVAARWIAAAARWIVAAARWIARVASTIAADTRLALNRRVGEAILTVACLAFIVWAFNLLNKEHLYSKIGFDEQYFIWTGWSVLKGLIPYRDFSEWKGPLVFLTHALALKLHGFRDAQFRWFFLYFPLASLIALYLAMLTRKIDKLCALALILAITHLLLGFQFHEAALSDSESIGLTFYFFGLACLLARTRFGDKLKAVGFGLLACGALSKEPYMPAIFVTWITFFFVDAQKATWAADAKRYFKLTVIGVGAVVVPLALYLVPTGGATYYVRLLQSYARIYKDPQHAYCVMFGRFTPTSSAVNDLVRQWDLIRTDFLNLATLGYMLPFAVLYLLFVPRRPLVLLTSLATLLASLWATTASKCQWNHYYVMAMAGLFCCFILGLETMARRTASASPRANRLTGWVLVAAVLVPLLPRLDKEMDRRDKWVKPNVYEEGLPGVLAVIAKHTKPTDRIFTTGPPGLYVMADRRHATRECGHLDAVMYGYPGNTDEERLSGLKAQLEQNKPKVVILDSSYEDYRPKHLSLLVMPFLKKYGYKKETDRIWVRPD